MTHELNSESLKRFFFCLSTAELDRLAQFGGLLAWNSDDGFWLSYGSEWDRVHHEVLRRSGDINVSLGSAVDFDDDGEFVYTMEELRSIFVENAVDLIDSLQEEALENPRDGDSRE